MLSRVSAAITGSKGSILPQMSSWRRMDRLRMLSTISSKTKVASGFLGGRLYMGRAGISGKNPFALGGSTRGYGGSTYHFSAAEKEESAIVSEKEDVDEATTSVDSGDSASVANKEEASEAVKELCEQILNLDVVEMNQLLFRLQSRLGISDAMLAGVGSGGGGGVGEGAAAGGEAAPEEESKAKDAFDVKLTAFDAKSKIKIIKEVRAASGLGLKEAKDLVEKAPAVIKEGLTKEEADTLAKVLTDLGGTVELV